MKNIYLLIASMSFALSILGLSKIEMSEMDSTTYSKRKIVEPIKRVNPQKKYRPMVLKPETKELNLTTNSQNWLSETFLAPAITASKSVTVQGGGNATPGGVLNYSITVSNTASGSANNATGVVVTDQLVNDLTLVTGSVKATPIAGDDAYSSIGNVGITVPAASGLLVNDNSPTNEAITVTAVNTTGTSGSVTFNPDGSFTFTPNAGFRGTTTFAYTLTGSSSNLTGTGTVTITVSNPIWFLNASAASGGNGTLSSPWNSVNNFNATSLDLPGDYIFIYTGNYSVSGTTLLLGQQKIIGQGAVGTSLASVAGITVPTFSNALPSINGTRPEWSSSANPAINLQSQNEVYGINVTGSTGVTMSAFGFTSMKIRDVSLNNTNGQAINFSNGALDVIFTSVSASGGTNGISLNNNTGSLQVAGTGSAGSGGTIQNTTGNGVYLNTAANVSLNRMNITNTSKSCFYANNLSGTCAINDCSFTLGAGALSVPTTPTTTSYDRRCVHILNENVAMTLNVNNSTFTGQLTTSPNDNHGLAYETTTSATSSTVGTLNIKNSTFNRFNNYAVYTTSTGAAITDVGIQNSSVNYDGGTGFVGGAFRLYNLRTAKTTFNILNNTSILTKGGFPIEFFSTTFDGTDFTPASGRGMEGKFNGNTLTRHSSDTGTGVNILVKGRSNMVVQVNGNTITKGSLSLQAVENTPNSTTETPRLDATVTNNIIEELLSNYGIDVLSGGPSDASFSTIINCVKISGNSITPRDPGGLGLIRFFTNGPNAGGGPNVIWLDGTNGTAETSLVNYWNNNSNIPTGVTTAGPTRVRDAGFGGTGNKIFRAAGTCLTPANAAPARIAAPEYVRNEPALVPQDSSLATNAIAEEENIEEPVVIKEEFLKNETSPTPKAENSSARLLAGETITVNGSGSGFSLPAGKSTTITFSATVSATPSTCAITNVATVSGSNFSNVITTPNPLTTNLIVPPPTGVTTATQICNGNSIGLVATCSSGTVQWYNAAATGTLLGTSASLGTFTQFPTGNTTYQAACKVGGCESTRTNSGLITVNPVPIPAPSSNSPVCVGRTLNLSSAANTSYLWAGPNSFTSSAQNPSISNVTSNAGGIYTITQTNSFGCTASATTSVTINALPSATASSNSPVSVNSTLNLSSTGGSTYLWSGPNAFSSTQQNPSIGSITIAATGTYVVTVTNNGCSATATTAVVVNEAAANSNSPICAGATLNLTGTGGVSYSWTGPNSFTSTLQNPSFTNATPSLNGVYTVTITASGGGTATATTSVTVNTLPIPNPSSNSPKCVGTTLSFNAVSGMTSYAWSGPNSFSSSMQSPSISNVTTAANGVYTLTVVNSNSCSASATTNVTINALPVPNPTSNSPICVGTTLSFNAASDMSSYSWSGPNSFSSSIQAPSIIDVTATENGVYTLTVVNSNGCSASATTSVTINTLPVPNPLNDSPKCAGTTVSFNSVSGMATYAWSGPNSFSSSIQTPSISNVTAAENGVYTLTVVNSNGCSASATTNVTINALPVPNPSSNSPVNVGGTLNLSSSGGGTYTWVGPNSFTSSLQNPSVISVTTAASGVYSVTVTNNGCSATATTLVEVSEASASNNSPVCSGSSLNLSASGGVSYFWTGPNSFSSSSQNPSFANATNSLNGVYTVVVTTSGGGTATATTAITVFDLPTVSSVGNQILCNGATTAAINFTGNNQNTVYNWTNSNNAIGLASSGTGNITSFVATNTTNTPITSTIEVTPSVTSISASKPITETFNFTGNLQTFIVPAGVTEIDIAAKGAQGGRNQAGILGGLGGLASGKLAVTPGQTLYIYVGGQNGYNGGGTAGSSTCTSAIGGNGGGASDIRLGGTALTDRVIVAGGGGGAGGNRLSGCGRGTGGGGGGGYYGGGGGAAWPGATPGSLPTGGTQTSGGAGGVSTYETAAPGNFGGLGVLGVGGNGGAELPSNQAGNSNASTGANGGGLSGNNGTYSGNFVGQSGAGGSSYLGSLATASTTSGVNTGDGSVTITYTASLVCTGPPQTFTITVNPTPTVSASSNSPICSGNSVSLSCSEGSNYSWTGPNGFSSSIQNPIITNVTTGGTYSVTITDSNGCTATATTAVTVNSLPSANPTNNTPICASSTLNLSSAQSTSYVWTGPNSFSSTEQNPSISNVTTAANGVYTLTVTNSNGCSASATTNVIVNALPVPNPTSDSPKCVGTTLSFNSVAGMTSYAWTGPNSFSSSVQTPSISNVTSAANGVYTLTVVNSNGCSASATTSVTINTLPVPNPSNDSPKCTGTTLSFNSVAEMTSYAWTGPNSFSSSVQTPSISNVTAAANGVYTLTVTNLNGCSASATTNVTINPLPVPNPTSNSPKCVGTTLSFNSVAGMTTYAWSGPNSFSSSVQSPSISNITAAANGIYTLTVTNSNGCSASATTNVTINPLPVPNPTSDSPKCVGTTLIFNSVAGMTSYVWTGPNSFSSSIQAPSISNVSAAANGTYTLTVTNANGCSATATTAVTINALPIPNPTSDSPKCIGTTLSFNSVAGMSTYNWTGPNSFNSSIQAPSISNVSAAAGGTYTLTVTNANGCSASATTAVTINALPVPNPTSDSPKCIGTTLSFNSVAGMSTYNWTGPNSFSSSIQAPSISNVSAAASGTYTLTVTNANGCSASATTAVTINALPIPNPTSDSPKCVGTTLSFNSVAGMNSYNWTGPNSFSSSIQAPSISNVTAAANGTYTLTVTNANGCSASATTAVTINALPVPNPSSDSPKCVGTTLSFNSVAGMNSYMWTGPNSFSSSIQAPSISNVSAAAGGTYTLTVTNANGCSASATTAVTINALPVPNPTSDSPKCIGTTLTFNSVAGMSSYNWTGPNSFSSSIQAPSISNVSLAANGTYTLTVTNANGCSASATTAVTVNQTLPPTITPPTTLVVCSPSTLTLTASGCAGTVTWSNNSTGTSLTLSAVGTYAISATCTINGCTSDASTTVSGLEIKALPIITATNTGPYTVGQTVSLIGTGAGSYSWTGPNNFSSTLSSPTISNALSVNGGVYTLSVTGINGCNAIATTNVIVSGIDPCDPSRIVDYSYVKAGNPYQSLFPLTNGMTINQRTDQVSILVNPVCPTVTIESFEMNIQGPELNWNIIQNIAPYALFDNFGNDVWGRNFKPGVYTLTVTGYAQDNKGGGVTYGPKIITFTVVGDLATINAPTLSKTEICAGSNVDVTFTTTGTFNGLNQFQVELSDSSGSFSNPVLIGTTNTVGTLSCLIPQNTVEGSKYLIRVSSTNQVVVGNPAMSLVTVHPLSYSLVNPTNNLTGTSTRKAVNTINASNKVTSPANVTYQAGKSILLTPGFESGAVFKAEIQGCN
ncbi:MAG: 3-coathanger stack domain-containing protein [Emticicia sp.]|uniref:Ig-like domain-containing protein n=1 Tax=Emticicia sp. TaxID=1930953 RepID=UPI003BA4893F